MRGSGRAFDFHTYWVTVEPSEQVRDIDTSPKFIEDNMLLTLVTIPELGAWALRISTDSCFIPCTM
jgi:hypothetical protein